MKSLKFIPFTHFLSIPLTSNQQVKKSVIDFFDLIVTKYSNTQGFHKSILTNPNHLHLTISMLKLFENENGQDDFEIESQDISLKKALALLQQLRPKCYDLIGTRSIIVKLKGLEIMNGQIISDCVTFSDDPKSVDVLYAKVSEIDGGNRLQKLCGGCFQVLTESLQTFWPKNSLRRALYQNNQPTLSRY